MTYPLGVPVTPSLKWGICFIELVEELRVLIPVKHLLLGIHWGLIEGQDTILNSGVQEP